MSKDLDEKTLKIVQLYPKEMNIYGDNGNVLVLFRRAKLYGFKPQIIEFELGDSPEILREADLIVGGGGQDSGQLKVAADLQKNAVTFREIIANGTPAILICGLYQLFAKSFLTNDGTEIAGIGVFDAQTIGQSKRLIGNISAETEFGELIGFENHSGLTYLEDGQAEFARVVRGGGNNGKDGASSAKADELRTISRISAKNLGGTEGARENNCFGSYLHGPILPKNPRLADELLRIAISRKYGETRLKAKDEMSRRELERLDHLTIRAREIALKRPR